MTTLEIVIGIIVIVIVVYSLYKFIECITNDTEIDLSPLDVKDFPQEEKTILINPDWKEKGANDIYLRGPHKGKTDMDIAKER